MQDQVLNAIQTDEQTQAYYYYLGISQFQLDVGSDEAIENFKIALSAATTTQNSRVLSRLCHASLSLIYAKRHFERASHAEVTASLENLAEDNYRENTNIIFYLASLGDYYLGDLLAAAAHIEHGIKYATNHNSHYMLANMYYLLAVISQESGQTSQQQMANQRGQVLADVFDEKLFDDL